jgi:ficolin
VGRTDGFNTNWDQYKDGFGYPGAYWLGLEEIHQLTKLGNWEVLLMGKHTSGTYSGKWGKLVYDNFKIGDEASGYKLTFGARLKKENSGEDSYHLFEYHQNMKFSTKDKDNDSHSSYNCAANSGQGGGGWWYNHCRIVALNNHDGRWFPDGASSQTLMAMRRM